MTQRMLAVPASHLALIPIKIQSRELLQITARIIAHIEARAHHLRVALNGEVMPMLIKDLLPGEITGALGIDDETVEIKNDCANGWGHSPTMESQ